LTSVISLKAETQFPNNRRPFNRAATGSGGEIRDRLWEDKVLPLAETAVYMTSYSD
jgi:phosphoribosylformylglycinamidine (FGAM) synthase-like enzyme